MGKTFFQAELQNINGQQSEFPLKIKLIKKVINNNKTNIFDRLRVPFLVFVNVGIYN